MPDAHVLYVVTAVVVFGLVVWVGIVLSLPDNRDPAEGKSPPEPTTVGDVGPKEGPTGPPGAKS